MSREPKFVPGERVILASSRRPECNGVHSVIGVHYKEMPIDGVTGEICKPMFVYALDGAVSRWDGWAEHLLRKLPPNTPSTFEDCIFKPEKADLPREQLAAILNNASTEVMK